MFKEDMSNLKKLKKLKRKLKKSKNKLRKELLKSGDANILEAIHAIIEFEVMLNHVSLYEFEWKSNDRTAEIVFI